MHNHTPVKLALLLIFLWPSSSPGIQRREVKPIGCFENVRSIGERVEGYTIRIWTFGNILLGIVDYHRGAPGDPPMGILSEVRYDPVTGKLSFEAELTTSLHYCSKHAGTPSHELLTFKGALKPDRLEGDLFLLDRSDAKPKVVDHRKRFSLPKSDRRLETFESYEIWWWYWEPAYQTRGPRW